VIDGPWCKNCAYSDDGNSPADPKDGEWLLCRRHPPVVFAAKNDGYDGGQGIFPRVEKDDWCGDWVQHCINTHQPKQRSYLEAHFEIYKIEIEEGWIEEDAEPHKEAS